MSLSDELQKLDEMHQRGALSDPEFAAAKARVLGEAPRAGSNPAVAAVNALRRSRADRWLGGVCGGLAQVSGAATWVWRLLFALLVLCGGAGVIVYALLWLFVPEEEAPAGASRGPAPAG